MTTRHSEITQAAGVGGGIHTTLAARPANAAALAALTAFPGGAAFADGIDVGKEARQEDTERIYILTDAAGPTWAEKLIGTAACFAGNLAGAATAGFMAAVDYVRLYGTAAAAVSVTAGAGYTTMQTTAALLAANNTSRCVAFHVTHNQALATLDTMPGSAEFFVARFNDGTQRIVSERTGLYDDGATPTLTGFLETGVGWQVTLNANGTVTFDLARNGGFDRAAQCRYWAGDLVTQVAP